MSGNILSELEAIELDLLIVGPLLVNIANSLKAYNKHEVGAEPELFSELAQSFVLGGNILKDVDQIGNSFPITKYDLAFLRIFKTFTDGAVVMFDAANLMLDAKRGGQAGGRGALNGAFYSSIGQTVEK
jgi:hypothetical protein